MDSTAEPRIIRNADDAETRKELVGFRISRQVMDSDGCGRCGGDGERQAPCHDDYCWVTCDRCGGSGQEPVDMAQIERIADDDSSWVSTDLCGPYHLHREMRPGDWGWRTDDR